MTMEAVGSKPGESRWPNILARVMRVQHEGDIRQDRVSLRIRGWSHPSQHVVIPLRRLPPEMREQLGSGTYLMVEVNLAAHKARDLRLKFLGVDPPISEGEVLS